MLNTCMPLGAAVGLGVKEEYQTHLTATIICFETKAQGSPAMLFATIMLHAARPRQASLTNPVTFALQLDVEKEGQLPVGVP